jgi:membrane protease YdiL (CAAX protease family)
LGGAALNSEHSDNPGKQKEPNMANHSNEDKGLWSYFILTYIIMLLTWGVMVVFQIPGASATSTAAKVTPVGVLLLFLGGFSPSIAGAIMTWRVGGRTGLRELWKRTMQFNLGLKWYLTILLIPIAALVVQVGVQWMRGGTLKQSSLFTHPLSLLGFTISSAILGGAIAEEFGWRGFALDRLLNKWNLWIGSLILGILWVFWHLPLFFIPGTLQASRGNVIVEFPIFALWIMSLVFLFSWLYINTGRSLFAVLLFHAAVDWVNSFSGTIINGGMIDRLVHAVVFAISAVIILIWWNPNRRPT